MVGGPNLQNSPVWQQSRLQNADAKRQQVTHERAFSGGPRGGGGASAVTNPHVNTKLAETMASARQGASRRGGGAWFRRPSPTEGLDGSRAGGSGLTGPPMVSHWCRRWVRSHHGHAIPVRHLWPGVFLWLWHRFHGDPSTTVHPRSLSDRFHLSRNSTQMISAHPCGRTLLGASRGPSGRAPARPPMAAEPLTSQREAQLLWIHNGRCSETNPVFCCLGSSSLPSW